MYSCIFSINSSSPPPNIRDPKLTPGLPATLKMPLPLLAVR